MTVAQLATYFKDVKNKIEVDLGEIILLKTIGQGGNGLVYEASIYEKKIAVKFLLTESSGQSKVAKERRFLAEYFNIATLPYKPSIIRYFDYGILRVNIDDINHQVPFIIMQLYDASLNKLHNKCTPEIFKKLFDFLIKTTGFIHSEGIIHRDIKPENILYKSDKFALTDFGIASYNPEIFLARAETKNSERVGNRLFSAPEQEISGKAAAPTMDIYAIGQVLQWFATGATHRGTGRQKIVNKFPDLGFYDRIIDRCLRHAPENRYQSVEEIEQEVSNDRKGDIFEDFYVFHDILTSTFPRNDLKIIYNNDTSKIDRLLQTIEKRQSELDQKLYLTSRYGERDFILEKSPFTENWKFASTEYKIKEVWIHYDSSVFNDFILVHYEADSPFIFEEKKYYYTTIVDNMYMISPSEANTRYAEIDGNVLTLSEHKTEYIDREGEEGYFFISTREQCVHFWKNGDAVNDFINNLLAREIAPTIDEIKIFERKIRIVRPLEVSMRL